MRTGLNIRHPREGNAMRFSQVGASLIALCMVAEAGAQEQGASIEGTVWDSSGALVVGARVEARNAAGLAVTTASGAMGRYRFPSLPAGRYEINSRLAGFSPARVPHIDLALGQILEVDLALPTAELAETVTVTADAPLIDVKQSARSTHIRDEQITKLPHGRDYTSLVTQAVGANAVGAFGGINIDGSSGSENRFVIDGAEAGDVISGRSGTAMAGVNSFTVRDGMNLVTDFVDEVQVKSSGYAAEYGGATGGVINVITRSGSNRWAGDIGVYYSGDRLTARPRPSLQFKTPTEVEYFHFPEDPFSRWEPGLSLSGPVKRDVAWFFASYQPSLFSTQRTATFRSNQQTVTLPSSMTTHNASLNITAQIKQRTRARVAFNMSPSIEEGVLPFQNGYGDPDENYQITTRYSNYTLSGSVDFTAAHNLFFTVGGSRWFGNNWSEGGYVGPRYVHQKSSLDMQGVPAELQRPQGASNVPSNSRTTRNIRTRTGLHLDGTWFVSAAGRHAVKAGVQLDRQGNDILSGETGNFVGLWWGESLDGQRGTYGYYVVRGNGEPQQGRGYQGDISSHTVGIFLQDAWTIRDRLTLNVGLRAENEQIPSFTTLEGIQPTAIDFGFGEKIAPRLGAAWDVKGDGKWKVYGSWGVFYDVMKYSLPRDLFGGYKHLAWWYTLDTPDWPNLMREGCPPDCPGTLIRGPIDFYKASNDAIDPDIEPFRLQEAVIGAEHELNSRLSVGVRYVHKQVDKAIEDIGTRDAAGNQVFIIGNPGFHRATQTGFGPALPKAVRDYDALEVTLDKRMADRWSLRVGYLWSRLFGNYEGLSGQGPFGIEGGSSLNPGPAFDDPFGLFRPNAEPLMGVLNTDRPHQLKAHVIYDFPFGTTVGVSARVMSGTPVTRYAPFVTGYGYSVAYRGPMSDGRMPVLSQVDLYAQHEVKLSGRRRLQASVTVTNLFDQDAPIWRYPNEFRTAVAIDEQAFFRGFDAEQLIAAQQPTKDPLFLRDYGFQAPREARLALKLLF
jgi:hypothetical protein